MHWVLTGLLAWLGGWWFTSRLFTVYRKAVCREEADLRRRGEALPRHHRGPIAFMALDFGLLVLGIAALERLRRTVGVEPVGQSLGVAMHWSPLISLFLFREATKVHDLFLEQSRARFRAAGLAGRGGGAGNPLWHETPAILRALVVIGLGLAMVPFGTVALGESARVLLHPLGGAADPFLLWFMLPQVLLVVALGAPLARLRRQLRTCVA